MVVLPFVYFLIIFCYIYRNNGFDISACIVAIYTLSAFFSIILFYGNYEYDLVDFHSVDVSFIPTFLYCFFISLCVYPFYKYNSNRQRQLRIDVNVKALHFLCLIYLAVFVFILLLFGKQILYNLFIGSMADVRMNIYHSINSGEDTMVFPPGPMRYIAIICNILSNGSIFMIPIFFYCLLLQCERKLFLLLILISSISSVVLSMLVLDRSQTVYWILSFVFCLVWFRQYFNNKSLRRFIIGITIVILSIILIYFLAVTISRFGERESGASGYLIIYTGQPFLNFCNIWNNYFDSYRTTERVLPLLNYLFGSGTNIAYRNTDLNLNVFFSFIGLFLVDLGHFASIVLPLIVFFINRRIVMLKSVRYFISYESIFFIFFSAMIIQTGVISYYYTKMERIVMLLFFYFFFLLSRRKTKSTIEKT